MSLPRMSLDAGAELIATADLTAAEFGLYLRLLLHFWFTGEALPDDATRLAAVAHLWERDSFDKAWSVVRRYFLVQDGTVTHPALMAEREQAMKRAVRAVKNGSKGGRPPRKAKPRNNPGGNPGGNPEITQQVLSGFLAPPTRAKRDLLRRSGSESDSGSGSPRSARAPSAHSYLLALFSEIWSERYRETYMPTGADESQLGRVLGKFADRAAIDAFPWRRAFSAYLADMGKFAASDKRHGLAHFCTDGGLNKYRVKDPTRGYTEREIENSMVGQEWLADRRGGNGSL